MGRLGGGRDTCLLDLLVMLIGGVEGSFAGGGPYAPTLAEEVHCYIRTQLTLIVSKSIITIMLLSNMAVELLFLPSNSE